MWRVATLLVTLVVSILAAQVPALARVAQNRELCVVPAQAKVIADACRLAEKLGEPRPLLAPSGGIALRIFIARPFLSPTIVRIDISERGNVVLTLRSPGLTKPEKSVKIRAKNARAIRQGLADSEFEGVGSAHDCNPEVYILAELADSSGYRTTAVCNRSGADKFPVGPVIDEVIRDRLNYRG